MPMIPCKISEAWLLCCLNGYKKYKIFESLTNRKSSVEYPKKQIEASGQTHEEIAKKCDPNQIDMPSFNRFKENKVVMSTIFFILNL